MNAGEVERVSMRLDALHAAASRGDGAAYWKMYTPSAVFLGTDAKERWTLPEFRAYADPVFARGVGWTYVARDRHVRVSADGGTAWFDEALDNAKYGVCRGTGVLVRRGDEWLVEQYHLTVPIPNELLEDVVGRIRALGEGAGR